MQQKSEAPKGRKSPKLKRMGLHERAAARMRAMIIRGELPPGSQTQETKLSKELGVSRTPLREAMKVLAAEGLMELRPNRSPRIADIEIDGISELFEALAGIERLAAELAAVRATERDSPACACFRPAWRGITATASSTIISPSMARSTTPSSGWRATRRCARRTRR